LRSHKKAATRPQIRGFIKMNIRLLKNKYLLCGAIALIAALQAFSAEIASAKGKKTPAKQSAPAVAPKPQVQAPDKTQQDKTKRTVKIVAATFDGDPGLITYTHPHVTTNENETLDADQLTSKNVGKDAKILTAEGNVKIVVDRSQPSAPHTPDDKTAAPPDVITSYTAYSDKAVYDTAKGEIILTGSEVKIVVLSPNTDGPMVTVGSDAVIELGKDPKDPSYPKITMHNVTTDLTPIQTTAAAAQTPDASSKTPKQ
jgi:lipopolysaccharide export system protein LptA